jgi:hypothetical protein
MAVYRGSKLMAYPALGVGPDEHTTDSDIRSRIFLPLCVLRPRKQALEAKRKVLRGRKVIVSAGSFLLWLIGSEFAFVRD